MSTSHGSSNTFDTPDTPTSILSLEAQFSSLVLDRGLKEGSKSYRKARNRFIAAQWATYFGEETQLGNWQKLCRDVGVGDGANLSSITKCRKALRGVWVNIWDLLDAHNADDLPVRRFPSRNHLIRYTVRCDRIFPLRVAKDGGPVKALLVQLFK